MRERARYGGAVGFRNSEPTQVSYNTERTGKLLPEVKACYK